MAGGGRAAERCAVDEGRVIGTDCDGGREDACRITGASRSSSSSSSSDEVSETTVFVPCFIRAGLCSGGAGLGTRRTVGFAALELLPPVRSSTPIFLPPVACELGLANNLPFLTSTSAFTNPAAALVPGFTLHLADKSLSRFFGLHISSPRLLFPHTLLAAFRASSPLLSSSHFLATPGNPFSASSLAWCFAASSCFSSVSFDIRGTPDSGRWISDMRIAFLACAKCCSRLYSARCTERV